MNSLDDKCPFCKNALFKELGYVTSPLLDDGGCIKVTTTCICKSCQKVFHTNKYFYWDGETFLEDE